jgi:hypothetical protein
MSNYYFKKIVHHNWVRNEYQILYSYLWEKLQKSDL